MPKSYKAHATAVSVVTPFVAGYVLACLIFDCPLALFWWPTETLTTGLLVFEWRRTMNNSQTFNAVLSYSDSNRAAYFC